MKVWKRLGGALIALLALSSVVAKITKDYFDRKK